MIMELQSLEWPGAGIQVPGIPRSAVAFSSSRSLILSSTGLKPGDANHEILQFCFCISVPLDPENMTGALQASASWRCRRDALIGSEDPS